MRKLASVGLAALCLFALTAADYPALPDGGSLVQPTDAGASVTVDTGHITDWVMTIRCSSAQTSPRCYYRLSADAGTATAANQLLDLDRTFDIPVSQPRSFPQRFLSLLGEDGGVPACNLQQQTPPD